MLNILSHCKKVAPSFLRAQSTDFISVCPAVATRGYSLCSGTVLSSRRCCRAQASGTKRYYSENYTHSSISNTSVDVFQKESHMTDTNNIQSKFKKKTKKPYVTL